MHQRFPVAVGVSPSGFPLPTSQSERLVQAGYAEESFSEEPWANTTAESPKFFSAEENFAQTKTEQKKHAVVVNNTDSENSNEDGDSSEICDLVRRDSVSVSEAEQ